MEFTFNASAVGAGAVIERGNVTTVIPSLASVALAPTGGEGRSVCKDYYSEELAFSHAETRVYGRELTGRGLYTTFTYVLVKNLNVFDKLSVAELRGTITSTRRLDDDDDYDFRLEASYVGVKIEGKEVEPKIDVSIDSVRRYRHLGQILDAPAFPSSSAPPRLEDGVIASADKQALSERFNAKSPDILAGLLKEKKPVQGSLIEKIEGRVASRKHHMIFIPGFGTVRFGELMLKPGRRRLNLLRIEFGDRTSNEAVQAGTSKARLKKRRSSSAIFSEGPEPESLDGSMTIASVEGNGTPIGP